MPRISCSAAQLMRGWRAARAAGHDFSKRIVALDWVSAVGLRGRGSLALYPGLYKAACYQSS